MGESSCTLTVLDVADALHNRYAYVHGELCVCVCVCVCVCACVRARASATAKCRSDCSGVLTQRALLSSA